MGNNGREVDLASDRFLARQRLPMFAGSEMPKTIVGKELVDNCCDVVNEKGQPATKGIIHLAPHRVKVMDNGAGISTNVKEGTDKTSLWLSCAKMFSSSNYGGVADTLGSNGVGMTMANYTSKKFNILNFNGKDVKGYRFTDGYLDGVDEESQIEKSGDLVQNPLSYEEASEMFKPMFERGFLVDAEWHESPSDLFEDEMDLDWLVNYARIRTAEINSGEIEVHVFEDDEMTKLKRSFYWNKNDKQSDGYLKSWDEQVKEHEAVIVKSGPWTFAFSADTSMKIESVCQGAMIRSRYATGASIEIQGESINMSVPFTMKYLSSEYPPYTDQTKVATKFPYYPVANSFEKSGKVYQHFFREAEKLYMTKVIKESESSNSYWPSLGPAEESELIIGEGYSPVSAIKNQRNRNTQACIALRGKILNCWSLDMVKAMRSEVVKQILNAVLMNNYKRIIIAVDADPDGIGHIASLLISMFARFTNIIQDKKLYYVHTPHYLFKKGKELEWSDNAGDCPKGFKTTVLKGLGGMEAGQIEKFIVNEETRQLIRIDWDEKAEESLDFAFAGGGEGWIIED